uniref:Phosphatidic acid phosphatase type 2/haloperoxidase domain-containing protein n=1 Tax=Helicotheca tamesis TaxID=374047 RepID=A0A7S2GZ35_9STRA
MDKLDKQISTPLLALKLPLPIFEYLLSIPGNFFGSCSFTVVTCPALIAICLDGKIHWNHWYALVGMLVVCNLAIWLHVLSPDNKKSSSSRFAKKLFYGPLVSAMSPLIGIALLKYAPPTSSISNNARQMGYFQMCAWSIGVIPASILKPFVARQRPATWINHEENATTNDNKIKMLQKAAREKHISVLPKLFSKDAAVSMASGDAAGAMACMYPLIFVHESSNQAKILAWICVCLSCVGRVYWFAHHVGDVLAGVITSFFACWILQHILCDETTCLIQWWDPLVAHGLLLVTAIVTRLMTKQRVFHSGTMRVEDKHIKDK